jgi:Protein of unknown function (DUF1552)
MTLLKTDKTRRSLGRRTLLRGAAGAMLGLPLLEAMLDTHGEALADGTELPCRLLTYFFGNGFGTGANASSSQPDAAYMASVLEPTTVGSGYEPKPMLQPFFDRGVESYLSVMTGWDVKTPFVFGHHEGMTAFNGYDPFDIQIDAQSQFYSKAGGPTIDQVVAELVGNRTPVRSVQVGNSKQLSIMDSGTTMHAMSHRSPDQPLYPEFNPKAVYDFLFGSFNTPVDDNLLRISSLGLVREQIANLRTQLGAADNARLDAHLEGVDQLEKKLSATPGATCTVPDEPVEDNAQLFPEPLVSVHEAMVELLAYAFACDVTRVGSYLFFGGAAETIFSDLGQGSVHHSNTHQPASSAQALVRAAVTYNMDRLAYVLERFAAWPDGVNGESLLDNTIVYASSDCSDGWSHSILRQPVFVGGRGGGALVHPGIHFPTNGRNISDILLTVLQVFAPSATEVGGGAPYSDTPFVELRS